VQVAVCDGGGQDGSIGIIGGGQPPPPPPPPSPSNETVEGDQGTLLSPHYPSKYTEYLNVTYMVKLASPAPVQVFHVNFFVSLK
jgi:hypothetical protein